MRIGLFILCYMDAFEPEAGMATLSVAVTKEGRKSE